MKAAPDEAASALRGLQCDLQNYLLDRPNAAEATIVEAPPLPVRARLGIYHNAYRVRLIDALREYYPVLHQVLGDEMFDSLGSDFIAAHPSVHRSIRWYGSEMPHYLQRHSPYAAQPVLAEVALLEWTLAEVFDAADAVPLGRESLSAVDPAAWSALRFEFHPSVRRLMFRCNTIAVWQAMSAGETPPDPQVGDAGVPWLLWRQDLQNYFRSLPADEAAALDAALRGHDFGEICESLADWHAAEEIPLRAAGLLGVWADSGIIVALL